MMKQVVLLLSVFLFPVSCNNTTTPTMVQTMVQNQDTTQMEIEVSVAENKPQDDTIDKEETVKQIKTLSSIIDKELSKYDTIQKIVFGYSAEGSDLTGYYNVDNLKKIMAKHASEYGNSIEQYYFDNGILILVHSIDTQYDKAIFETSTPHSVGFRKDYCYFNRGILLKWTIQYQKIKESSLNLLRDENQIDQNNEVIQTDSNYTKHAQALTQFAQEYSSKLSK